MNLPDLSRRVCLPELMDDPGLDAREHDRALKALARVAWVSGTVERIWREVRELASGGSHLRLLDVACGGGDVVVRLARRARRAGVSIEVHGCDLSPVALQQGRKRAEAGGVEVEFMQLDVLRDPLPGSYDLVVSSLFLHHLAHEDAVALLRAMSGSGRRGMVQDLRRTWAGYVLAWAGLRVLSRSRVAWVDGPRSVRAGFTLGETAELAAEAHLRGFRLEAAWPQRFVLTWGAR